MSVESILQQMAASAGNRIQRRADLWGGTIEGLSQIPGNLARDRERRALVQEQQRRLNAQDLRAEKDQAFQDRAAEADAKNKALLNDVIGAGMNPDGTLDMPRAVARAQEIGAPHLIPVVSGVAEKLQGPKPVILKEGETGFDSRTHQPIPGLTVAPKPPAPSVAGLDAEQQRILAKPEAERTPAEVASAAAYVARRAPTPSVPTIGSLGDYLTRYATEQGKKPADLTTAEIAKATKQHTDATQKTPVAGGLGALYADIDPKAIAAQIRTGDHPPDLGQYGRPAAAAIASELARKGPNGEAPFKLAAAQREWKAQLKLNSTMNGPQQVRLDESIRSGLAMYDKVDELAKQWDGMGIGPLSRANLAAARDGLKGKQAASIANQLTGQIGQLTSDIATIEQGGLTPTNEARAVAEQSMQAWWGKGTILDMTAQGRYNMQIRHAARNTQEPMTPGNGVDRRPALPATPPATGNTYTLVNGQWVKQ